jgi:hypothetical protein
MELRTRPLMTLRLRVAPPQLVGLTPTGDRRIVPVLDGRFEGERLRGTVEPGGSDWVLVRPDGALQLDVRLALRTDDDHLIAMTYRGIRHGPAAVIERVSRGEPVDPASYYFRMVPFFETASEKYGWLTRIVAVAIGERVAEGPIYHLFEVV